MASANVPNHSLCCPGATLLQQFLSPIGLNLAHFGEQIFSHACLHTLRWPHNLCDAAIRQVILFTRLRSTNNVFLQWFPDGFYSICTLSYENIVCTMIYKKFLKFAPPHVLCGHALCTLISDSCQVNYISWGSSLLNFRLIGPELRPQWKIEMPKSRNFLYLKKHFLYWKLTICSLARCFA